MLLKKDIVNILSTFATFKIVNNCIVLDNSGQAIQNADRSIYYDDAEHKFFEYIDFGNSCKKRAIAIGINPSLIEASTMDFTNKELVTYLIHQGYGGYILLNLFSKRTNNTYMLQNYNASMIGSSDLLNDCATFIIKILNDSNCNEDILIFWGQSFLDNIGISNVNLQNALTSKTANCYYSAGAKKAFVHPGTRNNSGKSRFQSFDNLIFGRVYW